MSNICSKCGNSLTPGAKFCPDCGAPVPETPARVCAACKTPLPEGVRFCPECGAAIGQAPENNPSPAPRTTAPEPPRMEPVSPTETFPRPAAPKAGSFVPQQPAPQAAPKAGSFMPQQPAPQAAPVPRVQQPGPQANALKPEQGPGFIPPVGPKKSKAGLIIGIIGAFIGVAGITLAILFGTGVLGGASDRNEKEKQKDTEQAATKEGVDPFEVTETGETKETEPADTETETEQTEPDMQTVGVKFDLREGRSVTYTTHNSDGDVLYVGTLTVDTVERTPVDQSILDFADESGFDLDLDYVVYRVYLSAEFPKVAGDEGNGPMLRSFIQDYYDVALADESYEKGTDSYDEEYFSYTAVVKGKERSVYIWDEYEFEEDDDNIYFSEFFYILMPKGYDGVVICFADPSEAKASGASNFLEAYKAGTVYHLLRVK